MQRRGLKTVLFLATMFVLIFSSSSYALESIPESQDNNVTKVPLEAVPTGDIESLWMDLHKEYNSYFPDSATSSLFETLSLNKPGWGIQDFLISLTKYLFYEVLYNADLLGMIILLTIFATLLQTMQSAFEGQQVSRVAYAIILMAILMIAAQSFSIAISSVKLGMAKMIDLMLALVPVLLMLLAAIGNLTSAALFHPFMLFIINSIGILIYNIIFPLLFFSVILKIVSSMSDKYKLDYLADLLNKISLTILGGSLTIFLGVLSIQGFTTSIADGFTAKTAKYVTGNFVPVIGRTISDTLDTVAGAALLLKNTVGVAGVILLFLICAFPALKILALAFVYKFSAAILQPLGNNSVVGTLSNIGQSMTYICVCLAIVGLMFFLAITIIVISANISLMLR